MNDEDKKRRFVERLRLAAQLALELADLVERQGQHAFGDDLDGPADDLLGDIQHDIDHAHALAYDDGVQE